MSVDVHCVGRSCTIEWCECLADEVRRVWPLKDLACLGAEYERCLLAAVRKLHDGTPNFDVFVKPRKAEVAALELAIFYILVNTTGEGERDGESTRGGGGESRTSTDAKSDRRYWSSSFGRSGVRVSLGRESRAVALRDLAVDEVQVELRPPRSRFWVASPHSSHIFAGMKLCGGRVVVAMPFASCWCSCNADEEDELGGS